MDDEDDDDGDDDDGNDDFLGKYSKRRAVRYVPKETSSCPRLLLAYACP